MKTLTPEELAVTVDALVYGQQRVRDSIDCPYEIKQAKLTNMQSAAVKLRAALRGRA